MCFIALIYYLKHTRLCLPAHTEPKCEGFNYAIDVDEEGLCEVTDHVTHPDQSMDFTCYVRGKCITRDDRFWGRKINKLCKNGIPLPIN